MDRRPDEEIEPVVALHQRNVARLGGRDVVIAAYPGSGASLISNILIELGLVHVDCYTEVIDEDGRSAVIEEQVSYRRRLSATAALDQGVWSAEARPADQPRFFKNHLYPQFCRPEKLGGAVLLVRDPRDAVYSSYQYFHSFSEHWLVRPKGQGTFAEYLDGVGINEEPPIDGWSGFYRAWADALAGFRRSTIIRFEDLKADPDPTTARLLEAFGIERSPESIARATRTSRYENMRAHEEKVLQGAGAPVADEPRVMRRGKVGEWREWYGNPELAIRFQEPRLVETAGRFGYRLTQSEDLTPRH
jgi:hypothetical protein